MGKIMLIVVILVLVVVGFFLFRDGDDSETDVGGGYVGGLGEGSESANVPGNEDVEETIIEFGEEEEDFMEEAGVSVREFDIIAKRWEFTPSVITVSKGDVVKLSIDNTDTTHGINIPDFGVEGVDEVEFIADKTGTFTFYCDNYCGEGHSGMSGTLIVE